MAMPRPAKDQIVSKVAVGQRLRALRMAQGMSQEKLAKLLGITQSNVSGLERGVRSLTIHQVAKLALALGASTDELLLGAKRMARGKPRTCVIADSFVVCGKSTRFPGGNEMLCS